MKTIKAVIVITAFYRIKDRIMPLYVYYNPLDTACKSILGGIPAETIVVFNIFHLKNELDCKILSPWNTKISPEQCIRPNHKAFFKLCKDNEDIQSFEMQATDYGWSISLKINEIGLYFYHFQIEGEGIISCDSLQFGRFQENIDNFLLVVHSLDYKTPDWFKGGVMYQIFPDRFAKQGTTPDIINRIVREDWGGTPTFKPNEFGKVLNNDFFGGNFKGIQSKLPYLKQLGVTVLYLNPIFQAASNHRYDTSDYMNIDPILGTENDFKEFIAAAKKEGISVILDGVFNHTGDDSVYFNKYGNYPSLGAYQSKESPYYSWYNFQEFPHKYSSWWGIDILPEINENSLEYQNFIFGKDGVLKKWLKCGIQGYRLDVADELPDFFLKKLRTSVKEENPNAIIIGEVWEDASNKIAYSQRREYLQGYELDSVMNYPLKDAIIYYMQSGKAIALLQTIRTLINHYPKQTLDCLMNILGTHDTARILTVLGGIHCNNKDEMAQSTAYLNENQREKAIKKLKMAAVLQYTMPGVPSVYYGDENGMEGHIDPFCRRCFDWEHLNEDLISFYQKLGEIRKYNNKVFETGNFVEVACNDGLIIYKRIINNEEIYVYANNSEKSYIIQLPNCYINLLNNTQYENQLLIQPNSYGILKEKFDN